MAVGFGLLLAGGIFYDMKRDDWAEPDLRAMRAYRVSLMSDDQIRQARASAAADADRYKAMDREAQEKQAADYAARLSRCADVVYAERNPECRRSTPLGMLYNTRLRTPTADQLYEEYLLGVCRFAKTKEEARINKCLPSAK